jgi:hypothetical protein
MDVWAFELYMEDIMSNVFFAMSGASVEGILGSPKGQATQDTDALAKTSATEPQIKEPTTVGLARRYHIAPDVLEEIKAATLREAGITKYASEFTLAEEAFKSRPSTSSGGPGRETSSRAKTYEELTKAELEEASFGEWKENWRSREGKFQERRAALLARLGSHNSGSAELLKDVLATTTENKRLAAQLLNLTTQRYHLPAQAFNDIFECCARLFAEAAPPSRWQSFFRRLRVAIGWSRV